MAAGSVLAFWLVAVLLIVVPGADWAFTISAGLRGQSVLPAVGGLVAGYAAVTAIVAAGVGAAVARSPAVLTGLTIVGGLYLTWHGALTLARPALPTEGSQADGPPSHGPQQTHGPQANGPQANGPQADGPQADARARTDWGTFVKGVGVSGLNPKGLLIFLALLPQFTNAHGSWPVAGQIAVLGLAFMLTCGGFYFTLGSVARTVLTARPAIARTVTRCSGLAMALIGIALLLDHVVA